MGKSLVIKGGNFAANGIPDLAVWTEITADLKVSDYHRQYQHYPNNSVNDQFTYLANGLNTSKICGIDVSEYIGKRIRVYWSEQRLATNYTGGCWWRCFASALAAGVTLPWNGTSSVVNAVTSVERMSGNAPADVTMGAEYSILTVPEGSQYLIFTNNYANCEAPRVWVEND